MPKWHGLKHMSFHIVWQPLFFLTRRIIKYNNLFALFLGGRKLVVQIRVSINLPHIRSVCGYRKRYFTHFRPICILFIGRTSTTTMIIESIAYAPCGSCCCFISNDKNYD